MAFRPTHNLIEGVLDNTKHGSVRGWIDFHRQGKQPLHCVLDLDGDFHNDIRGRILHFWNDHPTDAGHDGSLNRVEPEYMDHMHNAQKGNAGNITAQGHGVYIEWYSESNGRVVLSIPLSQCEVLGDKVDLSKLPPRESHPDAFEKYLRELSIALRKRTKDPKATVLAASPYGVRLPDETDRN